MENNNKKTDQELVQQTLTDPANYVHIFNRYYMPLLRYIRRIGCRDSDDAEDILQETFLNAYVNLNDYDADLKFSSWIYRIAHNKTISFFRKENIRPKAAQTKDQLLYLEMVADNTDLVVETDKKLLQERVGKALDELDEKYRDPLILKFLEDKSYDEISDILHIPIGTVGTLINRGKKQLKNIFTKSR